MKRMESSRSLTSSSPNVDNRGLGPSAGRGSRNGISGRAMRLLVVLASVLSLFLPLLAATPAHAAAKPAVTDTQNLLGSQGARIQESLDSLQKDTGVTLNLLFVGSFGLKKLDKTTIGKWVDARLAFTKPAKNTLLLAVASQDGQMALAVSKGSDSWLSSQVDTTLSDAAAKPLARSDPDWSGSVNALIRQIREVKSEHDSLPWKIAGGVALCLVIIALIVGIVLFVRWLRKIGFFTQPAGRHAAQPDPTSARASHRSARHGAHGHQAARHGTREDVHDGRNDADHGDPVTALRQERPSPGRKSPKKRHRHAHAA